MTPEDRRVIWWIFVAVALLAMAAWAFGWERVEIDWG